MDDRYLYILILLIAFFCAIIIYAKYNFNQEKFGNIPSIFEPTVEKKPEVIEDIHYSDTRYKYPNLPPANPIIDKSVILNVIPANKDLYNQMGTVDYPTNQLNYSGGTTQIIKIPLQMNYPHHEQLRSQEILITDYNKIKYGTC